MTLPKFVLKNNYFEFNEKVKKIEKIKSWFLVRGYPEDLIESEMKKVKFAVPFVMTYHRNLSQLKKLFLNI